MDVFRRFFTAPAVFARAFTGNHVTPPASPGALLVGIVAAASVGSPSVAEVGVPVPDNIMAATSVGAPTVAEIGVATPTGIVAATSVGSPHLTSALPNGISAATSVGAPSASAAEDSATTAWAAACTTPPTSGRRAAINTMIAGIKADGDWGSLGRLYVFAAEDSQAARLNIKDPSESVAFINSPTFTTNRGVTGDGSSAYIDIGEAWDADGHFTLNSATIWAYINEQNSTGGEPIVGVAAGSTGNVSMTVRASAGNEQFRINDTTNDALVANTGSKLGSRGMSRNGASDKRGYVNGSETAAFSTSSASVPTQNGAILRSGGSYGNSRVAALFAGSGMSATAIGRVRSRIITLLTAIGAN